MHIEQIDCDAFKENIVRTILEALPEWFGIPQAIEEYAVNSCGKPFFFRIRLWEGCGISLSERNWPPYG